MDHPNVIKLYEYYEDPPAASPHHHNHNRHADWGREDSEGTDASGAGGSSSSSSAAAPPANIYLVLEFCDGGELFDRLHMQKGSRYTEAEAARLMFKMVAAIGYCHFMGECPASCRRSIPSFSFPFPFPFPLTIIIVIVAVASCACFWCFLLFLQASLTAT